MTKVSKKDNDTAMLNLQGKEETSDDDSGQEKEMKLPVGRISGDAYNICNEEESSKGVFENQYKTKQK